MNNRMKPGRAGGWRMVFCAGLLLAVLAGCRTPLLLKERQREALVSYDRRVADVVADTAAAERLQRLGEEVFEQLRAETVELEACVDRLDTLNRDYDASREDLEAALGALDACRHRIRTLLLAARAEAVALTTAAEWKSITKRENSLMAVMQKEGGLM